MPAIRHVGLQDLTNPVQIRRLNEQLRQLTRQANMGGIIPTETPRASERSRFGNKISAGPPKGRAAMFRQVPTIPSDGTYGGRLKTQVFNGKEWKDVA